MVELLHRINDALLGAELFKITISKPRNKTGGLKNIFLKPIILKDEIVYQATYRYITKDQTKNYAFSEDTEEFLNTIESWLKNDFFNVDIQFPTQKWIVLQSKKGKMTILKKNTSADIQAEPHDHIKNRPIAESEPFLYDLGLSSTKGKVYAHGQDKYKQINKYIELISDIIKDENISHVVDMGSGKGYLTFALYRHLEEKMNSTIEIKGIELRDDLVEKCNTVAEKHNLSGLSFIKDSIADYTVSQADMVIALHACDIATDMAIAKGLEADAKFIIVAPCCHKQIRKAMKDMASSVLSPLLAHGILLERQAEMITDTIRALILESKGYKVKVFEFISSEHTGKNVMISATKTGKANDDALKQIEALKAEFGIDEHYLEGLVLK